MMKNLLRSLLLSVLIYTKGVRCSLSQSDEASYLSNFDAIMAASYSSVDDTNGNVPDLLVTECKKSHEDSQPFLTPVIVQGDGVITTDQVMSMCGSNTICIIPDRVTLQITRNMNVGALVVRGKVEWNDSTQVDEKAFLCAGYVAVEENGIWDMDMQYKSSWIYIKNNGAVHEMLRSRSFGGTGNSLVSVKGRELVRTWSLLSDTFFVGDNKIKLLHNPHYMKWSVGNRIAIASTEKSSNGFSQSFRILDIYEDGTILLDRSSESTFDAKFVPTEDGMEPMLMSAEVINLDRNIVITGDDFTQEICDPTLPESVPGEQTSTLGCRCSSFRQTCTMGLHTIQMHGGIARIQNTRVEKCGQRGVEGKYCLHFHMVESCKECLFRNNAIENSQQRGIIIHGSHLTTVEGNVLYNVRGAGIYIEDGNEMYNSVSYNTIICPFPFDHSIYHGCTVPGTSNINADTSDNQAGIFSRAVTNHLTGNRVSNSFNGMFYQSGSIGRGPSYGQVCEADARIGRLEGNTFHGHRRFGTYTLGFNYPKETDQSVQTNGWNLNKELCNGFDQDGNTRGISAAFVDNLDYGSVFVGHYEAGDIQYHGHRSYDVLNLMYWKETKNFENGCSAHISGSFFADGNIALPDQSTFIIENSTFGDNVSLEANHHCGVGHTGVLCMPQYILHNIKWKNSDRSQKWVEFQYFNTQPHNSNQLHGGIFTLSPPDVSRIQSGEILEDAFFPLDFVSLVSSKFSYLLSVPGNVCVLSNSLGSNLGLLYDNGILCKVPLRVLKVYSRDLVSSSAPDMKVEMWNKEGGIISQTGTPDASQLIGFHQIGADYQTMKQGYSLPVIPGTQHSYKLSLSNGAPIPNSWVIEFSDLIMSNRFGTEYLYLSLHGERTCGPNGLINSNHDRRYIWSGDEFMKEEAWGNHGACLSNTMPDMPTVDCQKINLGVMHATECPESCVQNCDTLNSFCDCGTGTCKCKPGFAGTDCEIDLCAAARCSNHGTCSAKYLGFSLPVTSSNHACICDEGWSGPLCQFNPCGGEACSGNGQCVVSGTNEARCECNPGFTGDKCEISCDGTCTGNYPYGCATSIGGIVKYGCHSSGACHYLNDFAEDYPFPGFCTYKTESTPPTCECPATECEISGVCTSDGTCSPSIPLLDGTPCNTVPFGECQSGLCVTTGKSPTKSPTAIPDPTCTCDTCTDSVLNSLAGDHTCGDRISWLQTLAGGSLSENEACTRIGRDEFPDICGPCDPASCNKVSSPPSTGSSSETPSSKLSTKPSMLPSKSPTSRPSSIPTLHDSNAPSKSPSSQNTSTCTCDTCTDSVLNSLAGDHTCGDRISWLQTLAGGSLSENEACTRIGRDEFPDICGPCDPASCNTVMPSSNPTITPSCGCSSCTEDALDTMAGDHSCGARISWLESTEGGSLSEYEACSKIGRDEFPNQCGACDPNTCNVSKRRLYLKGSK